MSPSTSARGRLHRDHGAVGVRQVDPDALPRGARPADLGHGAARRRRALTARRRELTELRRDQLGFVFQFFNLLPVLTAEENILLPLRSPAASPTRAWLERVVDRRRPRRPADPPPGRALRRPAAAGGGAPGRCVPARGGVRRRAHRQPRLEAPATRCSRCCADAVDEFGQTVVMVTHERHAAEKADRLITLSDGRVDYDGPARDGA